MFTYDLTTDVGKVRMLVPDRVTPNHIFEDAEIAAFLEMEGDTVKSAAALALETIASDQVMVLKVMRLMDLQTDGARVSAALLERAAKLRAQAEAEAAEAEAGEPDFDIAEWALSPFGERQRLANEVLRDG